MLARATFILGVIYYCTAATNDIDDGKEWKHEVSVVTSDSAKSDLFWKPFTGLPVPEDAILAGVRRMDGENVGVYIGQVSIDDVPGAHLQAVAIYNNSDSVTSTYYRTVTTTEKIKILCANDITDKLKWVSSEDQDKYEPDKDFVIVGHELSRVTDSEIKIYIGRGTYDDTFLVGKVVMGSKSLRFYPYYHDQEVLIKDDFEILAFV